MSVAGTNFHEICQNMNEDLEILTKYFKVNKLKLNVPKTACMLLANSKRKINNTLSMNQNDKIVLEGVELKFESVIKYLGIIIDDTLNFNEHMLYIAKKIGKKIGYLSRISKYISQWTKITVYKTIIAPHFDYCSSLFYNLSKDNIDILQKLQNRAMRTILKCHRRTHIIDMLDNLKWLSVKQIFGVKLLCFMYNVVNNKFPDHFKQKLTKKSEMHEHNLRNKNNIFINFTNKKKH